MEKIRYRESTEMPLKMVAKKKGEDQTVFGHVGKRRCECVCVQASVLKIQQEFSTERDTERIRMSTLRLCSESTNFEIGVWKLPKEPKKIVVLIVTKVRGEKEEDKQQQRQPLTSKYKYI